MAAKPKLPKDGTARVLAGIARLAAGSKRSKDGCLIEACRSTGKFLSSTRYVLSTGIESIDTILGGGFPFGKITELYGVEQSGKTALALRSLIQAQRGEIYEPQPDGTFKKVSADDNVDVTLVLLDNEQSVEDNERVMVDGVHLNCVLGRCDTVDQIFKIMENAIDELEAVEKETKRKQLLVFVVDTIAGTASREEMSADWDKDDFPRSPKMLRRGFRVLGNRLQSRNVALICTNQVSHKFSGSQKPGGNRGFVAPNDDEFSSPGGKALKFYAHVRLFLTRERDYKLLKTSRFPAGFISYATSMKNRRVPPSRFVRMCLLYKGGINNLFSILETLCTDKAFAERGKDGVVFKLGANGIPLTSFNEAAKSLEDLDEEEAEGKPVGATAALTSNADWPAFWETHPEMLQLWEKMKLSMFNFDAVMDAGEVDTDAPDESN